MRPNTAGQKRYVDAISQNVITFGIGPAGTGKSYLAVAQAVHALQSRQVARIILTRPAVEAGERLGFLPGDLMAKVDPYLRPLYDALYDLLEPEGAQRLLDRGTIEVAPLAFMRGRTLNSSFIILDEAQNTTPEQMKMFLTRIGFGSKCVVTGDVTQIDVPGGRSGLVGLEPVLGGIDDIAFVHLTGGTSSATRSWPTSSTPTRWQKGGRVPRSDHRRLRRRRAAGPPDGRRPLGELARQVLDGARDQGRDRGVAALRRRGRHRGAERAVPRQERPDRRAVVPDRGRAGADGPLAGLRRQRARGRRPSRARSTLLGDVVICPAVAARNAAEHEVPLEDEVALLVVHGLLHLLGMDHEDDAEAERMEALEQQLLNASTGWAAGHERGAPCWPLRASTPRTPSSSW